MQRGRHRLYSRLLRLNAGAHCASLYEPQVVVFRSRTGGIRYVFHADRMDQMC